MGDFYEQFKENIENRPEPKFVKEDWRKMEQRLDDRGKHKNVLPFWSFLGLMGLLLVSSNIWWYTQNRQQTSLNTTKAETIYIQDTIVRKEVIYQIDTIIQTRKIIETIIINTGNRLKYPKSSYLAQNLLSADDFPTFKDKDDFLDKKLAGKTLRVVENKERVALYLFSSEKNKNSVFDEASNLTKQNDLLSNLVSDFRLLNISDYPFENEIEIKDKEKRNRYALQKALNTLQPKGFQIGTSTGAAFLVGEGVSGAGIFGNLTANVKFSPKLSIWIRGSYQYLKYETENLGDAYGAPEIAPPADDLTLKYAKVYQPSLQLAVGMQYFFRTQKRLKPFIGIGLGGQSIFASELEYEYLTLAGSEVEEVYSKAKETFRPGLYNFQTGVEYALKNKWSMRFGLDYIIDAQTEGISTLQVKFGVHRDF